MIHPLFLVAFWLSGDARDRDESDSGFASKECPVRRGHSHDNLALLEDPQAQCRLSDLPLFCWAFFSQIQVSGWCFSALLLHQLVTHAFCFPSGVFRTIHVFIFLNRNNLSRNKHSGSTNKETETGLPATPAPATQTPSSRVFSSPPCVLLETVYAFIKQAGVYTSPWLFCTNQRLLYAWWSMIFVPHCLLEIGFRQSVPVLAAILYFFILFLQLHCVPLCGSDE